MFNYKKCKKFNYILQIRDDGLHQYLLQSRVIDFYYILLWSTNADFPTLENIRVRDVICSFRFDFMIHELITQCIRASIIREHGKGESKSFIH